MRKKEDHLEKEMMEVSTQNRRLADPLQKARDDMNEMQKKLGSYERDKQILLVGSLVSLPQTQDPGAESPGAPEPALSDGYFGAAALHKSVL